MLDLFKNMTLLDLCDILILAVLIYNFALLLKKETATRLISFLLVFYIAFFLLQFSEFKSTTWLLQSVFSSTLIIMAIIFQSDIRRAFMSFGRRPVESHTRDDISESIEELIKAGNELSQKRIGALIVIVRVLPIDHLLEVGTQIDAKVTSELLNSIFLPYSPIHDGAVIIQDGKITKAGCLLPLSRNPDIAKSFGTRHRAALGLSELADAMIMVVSEETGKISMVHDSRIVYDVDTNEIRRMLKKAPDFKRLQKQLPDGENK